MQMIEIEKLTPHPRNSEFFDDIAGDKWEDFKKSVVRRGVVEGIVTTQDLIIVSGHQRVRACKELGILSVPCRVTHYPDTDPQTNNPKEDMILEDLISTNILQRGIGNVNPMKMARCIVELERIYGIYNGNHKIKDMNNSYAKSQKDLANNIGVDQTQLNNYKRLNNLIPEFQEMVDEGSLKATTAYKLWAKMSHDEQEKLFNEIGKEQIGNMTQKQTQEYLLLQDEVNALRQQLQQEKSREFESNNVTIDNTDYSKINQLETELEKERRESKTLEQKVINLETKRQDYENRIKEIDEFNNSEQFEIDKLKKQKEKLELQAHISISDLQIKIHNFVNDASPSVFLQGAVASSSFKLKDDLLDSVIALEEFTRVLRDMIDSKVEKNQDNIIEVNY